MSRIDNTIKNTKYAVLGQILVMFAIFFNRMIFVKTLDIKYLGLNGLFTNIVSVLSFAELGIGSAIIFSLYKPLAEKNNEKVKTLMRIYKKAYIYIGIFITLSGFIILPFIGFFIKGSLTDIKNINLIFILFILSSTISYFYSYKRSLIMADQKGYIDSFYKYTFNIILNIFQILFLVWTKDFIIYLILKIVFVYLENLIITKKINKMYPYLLEKTTQKLDLNEKKNLIKNIKALVLHKVGSIVVLSTDNLLLSKFVGLATVGIYSNYMLIINSLNTIFSLFFQSIVASAGNLRVTEEESKNKFIFECIDLICFWIYSFASISLIILVNPFINLWFGENYTFSFNIVFILVLNFYIMGMRKSVQSFKEAYGLFWQDRFKPLFEATINLIASIILVKEYGTLGIFMGTLISTISTSFWIEPYILYKYGFRKSSFNYFFNYMIKFCLAFLIGLVTYLISNLFSGQTLTSFIFKIFICMSVPNILLFLLVFNTPEFKYLAKVLKLKFTKSS